MKKRKRRPRKRKHRDASMFWVALIPLTMVILGAFLLYVNFIQPHVLKAGGWKSEYTTRLGNVLFLYVSLGLVIYLGMKISIKEINETQHILRENQPFPHEDVDLSTAGNFIDFNSEGLKPSDIQSRNPAAVSSHGLGAIYISRFLLLLIVVIFIFTFWRIDLILTYIFQSAYTESSLAETPGIVFRVVPWIVIGFIISGIAYFVIWLINPAVYMFADRVYVPLGGKFRIAWMIKDRARLIHALSFSLVGEEVATKVYKDEKTTSITRRHEFYRLPLFTTTDPVEIRRGEQEFTIPEHLMHSFRFPSKAINWYVSLHTDVRIRPDVNIDLGILLAPPSLQSQEDQSE